MKKIKDIAIFLLLLALTWTIADNVIKMVKKNKISKLDLENNSISEVVKNKEPLSDGDKKNAETVFDKDNSITELESDKPKIYRINLAKDYIFKDKNGVFDTKNTCYLIGNINNNIEMYLDIIASIKGKKFEKNDAIYFSIQKIKPKEVHDHGGHLIFDYAGIMPVKDVSYIKSNLSNISYFRNNKVYKNVNFIKDNFLPNKNSFVKIRIGISSDSDVRKVHEAYISYTCPSDANCIKSVNC